MAPGSKNSAAKAPSTGDTAGGESGRPQRNPFGANSVTSMLPNSFYFVPTSGQSSGGTLYIDLPTGASPSSNVEISVRDGWIKDYTGSNLAHNDLIDGLTFQYSNGGQDSTSTNAFAPPALELGTNSTLQNCTLLYADYVAVSMFSGDTIKNSTINYAGCAGVECSGSCTGLVVANNTIAYNNYRHFDPGWGAGGLKFIANGSSGYEVGSVYGNQIIDNFGTGFWSDTNTQNTAPTPLLVYDNYIA